MMNKHDKQHIKEFFTWFFRNFTLFDFIFSIAVIVIIIVYFVAGIL